MTAHETEVLVVGAGPVGLMLAGALRRGGVHVVVVERRYEPTGESRASQLTARTMEVLDAHGLLGRFGDLDHVVQGHFGGLPVGVADVSSHLPGFWKVPQPQTEAVLEARARELGAEIWRGCELTALNEGEDDAVVEITCVSGTTLLRAGYVVGCDGEDSTVRALAGIEFAGRDATRELLRADLTGVEIANRSFERHPNGLAVAYRRPDGVTRVMVHDRERAVGARGRTPEYAEVVAAWRNVTGEDLSGATPLWVDAFDDTSRQAAAYRQGRILLAGDAAHVFMPVGGQALNLGLQDVDNLAWKLAATVAGSAPADLLDSYHDERHPAGARVLSDVAAQTMLLLGGPEVDPVRDILGELLDLPGVADSLAAALSNLDEDYCDQGHPLVGRRVPHLELVHARGVASTTALLRAGRGLLLELADGPAATSVLGPMLAGWEGRVEHVLAATDGLDPLDGAEVVLIRPDGYIAWLGTRADLADAESALRQWFGSPAIGSLTELEKTVRNPYV